MRRSIVAAAALAMLAGCAIQPPPAPRVAGTPPATTPAAGTPVGSTASGGTIRINGSGSAPAVQAPATVDSTPSAEALAVLKTIPEPLDHGASGVSSSAPGVAAPPSDTTTSRSSEPAQVPVPEPTEPLGDRPGSLASAALPDSLLAKSSSTPVTAAPTAGAPPAAGADSARASASPPAGRPSAAAPSAADTCWRVQLSAPPERERADRLAEAARSQLMIAIVVERERGLYKIRTRDCFPGATAEDVKRRALDSGFKGAFRFPRKPR